MNDSGPHAISSSSWFLLRHSLRQFLRLVRMVRDHWGRLAGEVLLGLLVQGLGMIPPYVSKLLIDRVYPAGDVGLLHALVAVLFGLALARSISRSAHGYFRLHVVSHLNNAVRMRFFNHLQHLPVRFFDQHRIGEVMSRFNDVDSSVGTVSGFFRTLFLSGIYLLAVPPLLLFLEWRLALLVLAGIPLYMLVTTLSGRALRPHWRQVAESQAELKAFQVEVLSHIRTFKAMALEHFVWKGADRRTKRLIDAQLRTGRISHLYGGAGGLLQAVVMGAFTWWGWELILSGSLSLGDLIAFTAYVGFLYDPIGELITLFSDLQSASVNLDRMFEYLDLGTEQEAASASFPPPPILVPFRGAFELRGVTFGYSPDYLLLRGADLQAPPGSRVAIVGPSGSGKTSLLRLLTRMEEPLAGSVHIDGKDLREIPLSVLRRQISVVWQETTVVQGTLWDNLTLGQEEIPRARVEEVVALCQLDGLVSRMPKGLDTEVGEWGANLSAGQRQRLALARALLRGASILILDEATSNIDVETEMQILTALFRQGRERTIFYVTHRAATAALADAVYVLENGRLQRFDGEVLRESEDGRRDPDPSRLTGTRAAG